MNADEARAVDEAPPGPVLAQAHALYGGTPLAYFTLRMELDEHGKPFS